MDKKQLLEKLEKLAEARAIFDKAVSEHREYLTDDEVARLERLLPELKDKELEERFSLWVSP